MIRLLASLIEQHIAVATRRGDRHQPATAAVVAELSGEMPSPAHSRMILTWTLEPRARITRSGPSSINHGARSQAGLWPACRSALPECNHSILLYPCGIFALDA